MNRSARVLILLNGDLGSAALVRDAARECGTVVCADGGARHAARLGIAPRLIIGDMDSLPAKLPRWPDTAYLCDFDPDCSDFEKALRFAVDRGFSEAWVAGGLGGALDHAAVNFALAERYSPSFPIRFIGRPEARLCAKGSHQIPCRIGWPVTLLAVDQRCRLTTRGLKYSLKNEWLDRGSRGLSNTAVGRRVHLKITQGRLWVIH